MLKIYGLKNCDTCRAAKKWLVGQDVEHEFLDVREISLDAKTILQWVNAVGMDILLNKRGTTWRKLDETEKDLSNQKLAIELMAEHPALIKRPVFDNNGEISVGFAKHEEARSHLLK